MSIFTCADAILLWHSRHLQEPLMYQTLYIGIIEAIANNNTHHVLDVHDLSHVYIHRIQIHLAKTGFTVLLDMHNMKLIISGWAPQDISSLNLIPPPTGCAKQR